MYTAKDFTHLLGLPGFSDTMLNNHFTLYQGYVNNVNILMKKIGEIRAERDSGDDARKEDTAELHRRFGWERNGMALHELYFENMTKQANEINQSGELYKMLSEKYGSFENFKNNFSKYVGMFRGIGWVALVQNEDKTLGVIWIGEHDEGLLANSKILLIMDVFEHAFLTDYGIKRADYINAFMNVIDWAVVEARLTK
jgi:Fe-Mn family superoxide dismutase